LREASADDVLAGEEGRAACGAGLLAVILQEANAFVADAIDVRRFIAHQSVAIRADIGDADVVAENDKDVGLGGWVRLAARLLGVSGRGKRKNSGDNSQQPHGFSPIGLSLRLSENLPTL